VIAHYREPNNAPTFTDNEVERLFRAKVEDLKIDSLIEHTILNNFRKTVGTHCLNRKVKLVDVIEINNQM